MPPRKKKLVKKKATLLQSLESQGRRVLGMINKEIAELEHQLTGLQDQAERWAAALEQRTRPGRPLGSTNKKSSTRKRRKSAKKRARQASPQVDWDSLYARLPKSFTMADIEKRTPTLAKFPKSRVVAVARWSRAKQIKKVGDRKYQKTA